MFLMDPSISLFPIPLNKETEDARRERLWQDKQYLLWVEFYYKTEEFDRTLPGRPSKHDPDSWQPDLEYTALSTLNAKRMLADLHTVLERLSYTHGRPDPDIRGRVCRLKHRMMKEILDMQQAVSEGQHERDALALIQGYRKKSMEPYADNWVGGIIEIYRDAFLLGLYDGRAGTKERSSRELSDLFTTRRRREHSKFILNSYMAGRYQASLQLEE